MVKDMAIVKVKFIVKCSNCGLESEWLDYEGKTRHTGTFDGEVYDMNDDEYLNEDIFRCPECKEILARDEKDAEELFKEVEE